MDGRIITLSRFPSDEKLKRASIKRLKNVSPQFSLNEKNDRLCSAHFVDGLYNKNNPVPGVFTIQDREKRLKTRCVCETQCPPI